MRIAALAAAALLLAACSAEVAPAPTKTPPADAKPADAKPADAKPADAKPADAKPAAGAAEYPLKTCVVSGEALGGMGEPFVYTHEGTEVRFCCGKCVAEFKKDPAKYMAILEAARKK